MASPRSNLYKFTETYYNTKINTKGSLLNVNKIEKNWASITYIKKNKKLCAYVPFQHIAKIDDITIDWVTISEKLNGTPYKWGGRDTIGIDCSALVQLSLQLAGKLVPRDTNMQKSINYPRIYDMKSLRRGMLVFWEGHVGILIDKEHIIHANAYHMQTTIEPLQKAINRIKIVNGDVTKILDLS